MFLLTPPHAACSVRVLSPVGLSRAREGPGFFGGGVMELAAWVFAVLVMVGVPLACWWVL